MQLSSLDWVSFAAILAAPLAVGIFFYRRAGRSLQQYFLAGRDLPWWLSGTSMVATTFAADTPLAVTGIVALSGIAGNWIWWNAALGTMLTVFFFARLWRRAGITTDVEFAELRYTGRPAALLRGLRALYLGLPLNCLIIGWVNLALAKVLAVMLGWERMTAVFVGLAAAGVYTALSGLRGVVVSDLFLFVVATVGAWVLALFVLAAPDVGGLEGLTSRLPEETFRLLPQLGAAADAPQAFALPLTAFIAFLGLQWWASWYPGQEPGGGGYIAQRMMSSRDERHALLATLWFAVAHYCLRPWPWIVVALAALVLYPDLADRESGYALAMRDHLPAGVRGLLVGSFFAAYMSTVSTQLNWGTSYLINDVYGRFVRRTAGQRELVTASRLATVLVMLLSGWVTFYLDDVRQAWEFALESGAGRRAGAHPALVLVARERRLRNCGAGGGGGWIPLAAPGDDDRLSRVAAVSRALDDRVLDRRYPADAGGTHGAPGGVLPARAAGRAGLGAGGGAGRSCAAGRAARALCGLGGGLAAGVRPAVRGRRAAVRFPLQLRVVGRRGRSRGPLVVPHTGPPDNTRFHVMPRSMV